LTPPRQDRTDTSQPARPTRWIDPTKAARPGNARTAKVWPRPYNHGLAETEPQLSGH